MPKRVGAICNDDSITYATGRGAGSHHGGVKSWIYEGGRVGAICNDGSITYATGRGAGSHHGGVKSWIY